MKLTDKIVNELNKQIGRELHNANQYLAIAAYFKNMALFNIAKEYQTEAEGERQHAQKLIDFLVDFRGELSIPAIEAPTNTFDSAVDAARSALSLELQTTEFIYDLVDLAKEENNKILWNFLQWFVGEQQEEIATANDRLDILHRNQNFLEIADLNMHETVEN